MKSESRGLAALAAQVGHYRLVFHWPERTISLLIPGLILLSVVLHAMAFYIFQVVYPPSVASAPPSAQVTLLTPDTREGATLLRWVQAQDPATAAQTREVTPAGLGEIRYTPSYAAVHTLPLEMEAPVAPIEFPAAHSLLDFNPPKAVAPEPSRRAVASALGFSGGLRTRAGASEIPRGVTSKSSPNLRPTVFLTGVSDRGEVRYCFLLAPNGGDPSSGDPEMDKQAETLLREHRFAPSETPLEWGFATFNWGADAYAPAPQPSASP